ncbi:MAG: nitrite reductase, copper-containing [Bdellovibrionales bacterium]|nr:nitrite reductase, copper-containing [Bdellovibrionales bacterium]
MKHSFLFFILSTFLATAAYAGALPVEKGVLTDAPLVPPVITRDHAAIVQVELEVIEKVGKLADGVDYTFWTFGGSVPGKFIRVRHGDTVEFTLTNNGKNKLPHNIDLHAVSGPGGGAAVTATAPGQKSKFTFKALNPGLYVYHCATAPVGMHIANGMYGLIYVQPEIALSKVDHEYYIFQSDFYTKGKTGEKGLQPFSQEKAVDEKPTYVVFNGAQGSLTGDNALKAKVGETVRLFIGNGGPNLISSFHVIGEIFDKVYTEGGSNFQDNVQTTLIPSGGSTIVEFKLNTAGTYLLVDHSIFRTFHKGTLGMLKVEGEADTSVFKAEAKPVEEGEKKEVVPEKKVEVIKSEAPKVVSGKDLFAANCMACHGEDGKGADAAFPPLAKSDLLKKLSSKSDRTELISFPLLGKKGKITVNGKQYDGEMPVFPDITDKELASVLTYISNSWGNKARKFTEAEVTKARNTVMKVSAK